MKGSKRAREREACDEHRDSHKGWSGNHSNLPSLVGVMLSGNASEDLQQTGNCIVIIIMIQVVVVIIAAGTQNCNPLIFSYKVRQLESVMLCLFKPRPLQ